MALDISVWMLPQYPVWLLVYIFISFLVAGAVKGFLGIGLPTVLMTMLTLFISPVEAITLIAIPLLLTNFFQYLRSRDRMLMARRYAPFAFCILATIAVVSFNILHYPETLLLISIGVAMVLFAVNSLVGFPLRLGPHLCWQVVAGVAAGALGGMSTIWAPAVAMYLIGRNVGKEEFIGAVGFIFTAGGIGLALSLGTINVITLPVAGQSLVTLAVTLMGFRIGELLRGRIDTEFFRKCLLVAFLVMGVRLILVGLIL